MIVPQFSISLYQPHTYYVLKNMKPPWNRHSTIIFGCLLVVKIVSTFEVFAIVIIHMVSHRRLADTVPPKKNSFFFASFSSTPIKLIIVGCGSCLSVL